MIVEVTSPAYSRRVAHLDAVKRELSITGTSEDDDILEAIDMVSAEFVRLLGREPWYQTYKIRMPGDGGTRLWLPVGPIWADPSLIRTGESDPQTMTASDYEFYVNGRGTAWQHGVYRADGWVDTAKREPQHLSAHVRDLYYEVTTLAGWACPLYRWQASTAVRKGEWTLATDRSITVRFECTTAGTTGASEPTWDTTEAATTTDSGATWTARVCGEMPANLARAGLFAAKEIYRDGLPMGGEPGVSAEAWDGERVTYSTDPTADTFLPAVAARVIRSYSYAC